MSLPSEKRALRRRIQARRDAVDPGARALRSAAACERLRGLEIYRAARTVHLFVPFRSELDTRPILEDLWARGVCAVLPRVAPENQLHHLRVLCWEDLEPGAWDIPEPVAACPAVEPARVDLVCVPGVAFDRHGGRLGYGGGFYDRFGESCPAPRVALAFELQLVDRVPCEPHDLGVHTIVTEAAVYEIS